MKRITYNRSVVLDKETDSWVDKFQGNFSAWVRDKIRAEMEGKVK